MELSAIFSILSTVVEIKLRVASNMNRTYSLNPHYEQSLLTMAVNHQFMTGFGWFQPFPSRDAGCGCCSHAEEALTLSRIQRLMIAILC